MLSWAEHGAKLVKVTDLRTSVVKVQLSSVCLYQVCCVCEKASGISLGAASNEAEKAKNMVTINTKNCTLIYSRCSKMSYNAGCFIEERLWLLTPQFPKHMNYCHRRYSFRSCRKLEYVR